MKTTTFLNIFQRKLWSTRSLKNASGTSFWELKKIWSGILRATMDMLKCIFHLEAPLTTQSLEKESNSEEAMVHQEKSSLNRQIDLREITQRVLGGSASMLTHLSVLKSSLMRKISKVSLTLKIELFNHKLFSRNKVSMEDMTIQIWILEGDFTFTSTPKKNPATLYSGIDYVKVKYSVVALLIRMITNI